MSEVDAIRVAVRGALAEFDTVVLAVSGGVDSMTLLDAAAATTAAARLVVATFDHSTGAAATNAAALVMRRAAELGARVVAGKADHPLRTEAELRAARWKFLRAVASTHAAAIATAHTESDQVETVLLRVLRDAGARGLAGLYANTGVVRPLIGFSRAAIVKYAAAIRLEWVDDPSNAERRFARNRARHDLLPALRRVRPDIDRELLALSRSAADWRGEVEAFVDAALGQAISDIPVAWLADRSREELCVLWPTIVGRSGVTLDRRNTERLADFTASARVGSSVPLAGGWRVVRARDAWQLRASPEGRPSPTPLVGGRSIRWGDWSFRPAEADVERDTMRAWLPLDEELSVRCWEPGDAMIVRADGTARKVKQLLSRAGVTGHERSTWPVVLAGSRIVWIPGVRRGEAATARSGRPGLAFGCEHHRT